VKEDGLRSIEAWTKIVTAAAAVAVPVAVALVGWWIQTAVQRQTVDRDYVQIAISILRDKEVPSDLKEWATALLSSRSPVPFGTQVQKKLNSGELIFPKTVGLGFGQGGFGDGPYGGRLSLPGVLVDPKTGTAFKLPREVARWLESQPLPTLTPSTLIPGSGQP
jgi:hypothetical protein